MCHAERQAIYDWLAEVGAVADDAADIRRKVIASRGEHEAEEAIADQDLADHDLGEVDPEASHAGSTTQ